MGSKGLGHVLISTSYNISFPTLLNLMALDESKSRPLPELGEEVDEVGEIRLASRGVDNGLDGDAEERQCGEEDEHPEDELKHM